jgi:hypothetical protein
MSAEKLNILNITEYNLLANKNPRGNYDRATRENLYWVIEKLRNHHARLSPLESRLFQKFYAAQFAPLEDKDKKVRFAVRRYMLTTNVKRSLAISASALSVAALLGLFVYQLILDTAAQKTVDMKFYAELNKMGLVSKDHLERIKQDLTVTTTELERTKQGYEELSKMIEAMIQNNKVTENLKYILKQVYRDPRTQYVKNGDRISVRYNSAEIATYRSDPQLWYLVGVIDTGLLRVFYNNQEILEIEAIFGRKGEETPVGEYEIKNKVPKPTWFKKESVGGKTRVRAIPYGDPEHDIGNWWMGLNKLGDAVPGSYGLHGVNPARVNEFFKKNYDWRNGSAGCPNIQDWFLDFLANVLPVGTRVNIVPKDKWVPPAVPAAPVGAAA